MKNLRRKAVILVKVIDMLDAKKAELIQMQTDKNFEFTEIEINKQKDKILEMEVDIQVLFTDIKKIQL